MPWQFPLRGMRGPRPYVAIHRRSFQSSRLRHPRCNLCVGPIAVPDLLILCHGSLLNIADQVQLTNLCVSAASHSDFFTRFPSSVVVAKDAGSLRYSPQSASPHLVQSLSSSKSMDKSSLPSLEVRSTCSNPSAILRYSGPSLSTSALACLVSASMLVSFFCSAAST